MAVRSGLLIAACTLGGCDLVWGLSGEPPACDLGEGAFDGAERTDLMMAVEDFSVAVENDRVIGTRDAATFEIELDFGGAPVPIALGEAAFVKAGFGLAPEGDLLFFSNEVEIPELQIATRTEAGWTVSVTREKPAGLRAGTPTALVFGARRVLVRVGEAGVVDGEVVRDVQEYVEDGDRWRAVGPRQSFPGSFAPNLTPNGMTAVFTDVDEDGRAVVAIATRDSVSDAFAGRTVIYRGDPAFAIRTAQLRDDDIVGKQCGTLFVAEGNQLRRYDR